MAREKIAIIPMQGVQYLKPAHNPTGELIKVIQQSCIIKKRK